MIGGFTMRADIQAFPLYISADPQTAYLVGNEVGDPGNDCRPYDSDQDAFELQPYLIRHFCQRFQAGTARSEEHTSELQSLMRNSYAVFCLKKQNKHKYTTPI